MIGLVLPPQGLATHRHPRRGASLPLTAQDPHPIPCADSTTDRVLTLLIGPHRHGLGTSDRMQAKPMPGIFELLPNDLHSQLGIEIDQKPKTKSLAKLPPPWIQTKPSAQPV